MMSAGPLSGVGGHRSLLEVPSSVDPLPNFLTLAAPAEAEIRVKGSRFLAIAFPARNEDEARSRLKDRESTYFDARHHCGAWRFADGVWRALDAGEPSGSAGAPILAAIDGPGLLDVGVVVTRYFGGTRLGIGGLVRAYGDAAATAIALAPVARAIPAVRLEIHYPFGLTSAVMRAIERHAASGVEHGFSPARAEAWTRFTVPLAAEQVVADHLRDQTSGALRPEVIGYITVYEPG